MDPSDVTRWLDETIEDLESGFIDTAEETLFLGNGNSFRILIEPTEDS